MTETTDSERKSWDRQPGEKTLWFHRFEAYRSQGPGRALLPVYRFLLNRPKATKAPGSWKVISDRWEWKKRAAAWDDAESQLAREAEAEARKKNREMRLKLLDAYRGKVTQAMAVLHPLSASWRDVTAALAMLIEQSRYEYGEGPADNGPLDIILHWSDTPPPNLAQQVGTPTLGAPSDGVPAPAPVLAPEAED